MHEPRPGVRLGPYLLIAPLGAGGMGQVFVASGPDGGRVALKTLHPSAPAVARRALRREWLGMVRLSHPGIPAVLAQDVDGPVPWMAMELIDGRPLSELLGRHRTSDAETWDGGDDLDPDSFFDPGEVAVPSTEALTALGRVARLLAWVHGEGLVHGDLKPENVLLRPDGSPVLVDFGLRVERGARERLEIPVAAGTPEYMAPEQLRGDPIDARADLYALGRMLAQVLGPDAPESLYGLRDRLLEPRVEDRTVTAAEVADVLGAPVDGPPPRRSLLRPGLRGRDAERDALSRAEGLRWVIGPEGGGKTRLVEAEVVERRANRRRVVASARDRGNALASMLRELRDLGVRDPGVAAALGAHGPALARVEPSLGAPLPPLPPESERARVVASAASLIDACAPILVVLDDLQDADDPTLAVLEAGAHRHWKPGVTVLALSRDDANERVRGAIEDAGAPLVVGSLPPDALRAMALELLGLREAPRGLDGAIGRAGSASEVIERVHAWVDAGGAPLPEDRDALDAWRWERLPPEAREVALGLAWLGPDATIPRLQALFGPAVEPGLAALHRDRWLEDGGLGLAGGRLEAVALARSPAAEAVAAELLRGVPEADPLRRLDWAVRVGDPAAIRDAALAALPTALSSRARFSVLDRLVDAEAEPEARARWSVRRADELTQLGRRADALEGLRGLEGALRTPDDLAALAAARAPLVPREEALVLLEGALRLEPARPWRVRLHVNRSIALFGLGRPDEADRSLDAAAAEAEEPDEQVGIAIRRSILQQETGRHAEAERTARAVLTLAQEAAPVRRAELLMHLGSLVGARGSEGEDEARALIGQALATHRSLGNRRTERVALTNLANRWYETDPAHAAELWERGLALARLEGEWDGQVILLGNLSAAAWRLDQPERARALATEGLALARAKAGLVHLGRSLAQTAWLFGELRDLEHACALADEAIAVLTAAANGLWLPFAYRVRGMVEHHTGGDAWPWLHLAREAAGDDPTLLADVAPLEEALRATPPPRPGGP